MKAADVIDLKLISWQLKNYLERLSSAARRKEKEAVETTTEYNKRGEKEHERKTSGEKN